MKQGTYGTLQSLVQEIERQQETKVDLIAPTQQVVYETTEFYGGNYLRVADRDPVEVTRHTMRQMATWATNRFSGYAETLYDTNPALLAENMNYWLQRQNDNRMIRQLDGKARAFVSDKYKRIDNYPVLESALTAIRSLDMDVKVDSCDVTENKMYLKVTSPKLTGEIKKGDPVQLGVAIGNSEIGLGSYFIDPFMKFLVCTNGMIGMKSLGEGIRMRHLGAKQAAGIVYAEDTVNLMQGAFALQVRDTIAQFFSTENFNYTLDRMRGMTERQIEGDPVKAVEVLSKTFGITQDEQSGIMRHLITGGDLSQYGVMNAVTRTAQDLESYDRATEFEQIGGKIVELNPRQWKVIAEAA